jgi:hypothetical protein
MSSDPERIQNFLFKKIQNVAYTNQNAGLGLEKTDSAAPNVASQNVWTQPIPAIAPDWEKNTNNVWEGDKIISYAPVKILLD